MSVARVTELSAVSEKGFEDAINQAIARANQTLRGVEGCWVKDMNVLIEDGSIVGYKDNDAIAYPDSGKLLVACVADENGEREDRLGRLQEADYFDGEL